LFNGGNYWGKPIFYKLFTKIKIKNKKNKKVKVFYIKVRKVVKVSPN
jgi:hypothetical protein